MDTSTFTYIFRNITGVSYDYAVTEWLVLSDELKCMPQHLSALIQGRDYIRWKNGN